MSGFYQVWPPSSAGGSGASGVTTIGSMDGQAASVNGASVGGSSLFMQSASSSSGGAGVGLVNTVAQPFLGTKTFVSSPIIVPLAAVSPVFTNSTGQLVSGSISLTTQVVGVLPLANTSVIPINPAGQSSGSISLTTQVSGVLPLANMSVVPIQLGSGQTSGSASLLFQVVGSGLTLGNIVTVGSAGMFSSLPYSTAATASNLVFRDTNGAALAVNFVSQSTTTQSSGTSNLILTAASSRIQRVIGSNSIAGGLVLPTATTLTTGEIYELNNNATTSITIFDTSSTTIATAVSGSYASIICVDNSTTAGVWDVHWSAPKNATWGTNFLAVTGSITTTSLVAAPVISNANGALTNGSISITNQIIGILPQGNLTLTPTFTQATLGSVSVTSSAGGNAYTVNLPGTSGSGSTVLSNNGSGNLSWSAFIAPTRQTFAIGSATGTYTTPTNPAPLYLKVRMVGGGGAGGGGGITGSSGSTGSVTSFGSASFIAAFGGVGGTANGVASLAAGGVSSVSLLNGVGFSGAVGGAGTGEAASVNDLSAGGMGGATPFGGGAGGGVGVGPGLGGAAAARTGAGGGGGGAGSSGASTICGGNGGGSGAYVEAIFYPPNASYPYQIGAGGTGGAAGTAGGAGGAGGSGFIIVEEFYL